MRKVLPTYNSYVAFLIANCKLTYKEVITKIADYTADENFSIKDIEYLSNLGISNIRNENEEFKRNNRLARRIHCALVEYCIESYGIEKPASFKDLRNVRYSWGISGILNQNSVNSEFVNRRPKNFRSSFFSFFMWDYFPLQGNITIFANITPKNILPFRSHFIYLINRYFF